MSLRRKYIWIGCAEWLLASGMGINVHYVYHHFPYPQNQNWGLSAAVGIVGLFLGIKNFYLGLRTHEN